MNLKEELLWTVVVRKGFVEEGHKLSFKGRKSGGRKGHFQMAKEVEDEKMTLTKAVKLGL